MLRLVTLRRNPASPSVIRRRCCRRPETMYAVPGSLTMPSGPCHGIWNSFAVIPSKASTMPARKSARRNSPSVKTSSPASFCILTAAAMASFSASQSSSVLISPVSARLRASSSAGGRSRLPTWSPRNLKVTGISSSPRWWQPLGWWCGRGGGRPGIDRLQGAFQGGVEQPGRLPVHRVRRARDHVDPRLRQQLRNALVRRWPEHRIILASNEADADARRDRALDLPECGRAGPLVAQIGHPGGVERPHLLKQEDLCVL